MHASQSKAVHCARGLGPEIEFCQFFKPSYENITGIHKAADPELMHLIGRDSYLDQLDA